MNMESLQPTGNSHHESDTATTPNIDPSTVETPTVDEIRDSVLPDRKASILEKLDTRGKKVAASLTVAALALGGAGYGGAKIAEALASNHSAEQPGNDQHNLSPVPSTPSGNTLATSNPSASAIPSFESSGPSVSVAIPEKAKGYLNEQQVAAIEKAKSHRITAEDIRGLSDAQIIEKVALKKDAITSVNDFGPAFARQLDIASMAGATAEEFNDMGGPSGYTMAKGTALAAKYDRPITTAISGADASTDPTIAAGHAWNVRNASNMRVVHMPQAFDSVIAATDTQLVSGSIESGAFSAKINMVSMDNVSESGYGKWLVQNGIGYDKDNIATGEFTVSSRLENGVWISKIINHTGTNLSQSIPR